MTLLNLSDAAGVRAQGAIPDGEYTIALESAEVKDTTAGTGQYIRVKFKVLELQDSFLTNFNIKNPNPETVKIGMGQLKSWLVALGLSESVLTAFDLTKFWELNGKQCRARLKTKEGEYGFETRVTSYKKLPLPGEQVAGTAAAQGTADTGQIPF